MHKVHEDVSACSPECTRAFAIPQDNCRCRFTLPVDEQTRCCSSRRAPEEAESSSRLFLTSALNISREETRNTLAAFTWAKEAAQVQTSNWREKCCDSRYPKISQTSIIVRRERSARSAESRLSAIGPSYFSAVQRDHPAEGARATRDTETKAHFSAVIFAHPGFRNETSPFDITRSR